MVVEEIHIIQLQKLCFLIFWSFLTNIFLAFKTLIVTPYVTSELYLVVIFYLEPANFIFCKVCLMHLIHLTLPNSFWDFILLFFSLVFWNALLNVSEHIIFSLKKLSFLVFDSNLFIYFFIFCRGTLWKVWLDTPWFATCYRYPSPSLVFAHCLS